MADTLEVALAQRADLDKYGSNKRLLFALQMVYGIDDIETVATSALTDGSNDKACDLLYIDRGTSRVVLAQGYESADATKKEAKAAKAASLGQAVNWLLSNNEPVGVSEVLLSAWRELRDALTDAAIDDLEIWYVHNLPESENVERELIAARDGARALLRQNYPDVDINVSSVEYGRTRLNDRYVASRTPILVSDSFTVQVPGAFEETGDKWTALCTSVPASWIHEKYRIYGADLFSANVRGYLGSRRSQSNINNGIQQTVREEPGQLWPYNNGITALVHSFRFDASSGTVEITGLTIVNGAQTTGAIGSITASEVGESRLMARFIQCNDPETVLRIVRYNNRQNPTQATDFRSNDGIQTRLVKEFDTLGVVGYTGGRRGGAEDVIRRPGENQLSTSIAAQALAAFHGGSDIAYHEKSKIWEQDAIYSSVFPDRIDAPHILFVSSLLRAVEEQKTLLGQIPTQERTGDQNELLEWFGLRGSIMLAVEAIGASFETILESAISDKYALRFADNLTVPEAMDLWRPIVESLLALAPDQLREPLTTPGALRNREAVAKAVNSFRSLVVSARRINKATYAPFAEKVAF
ncbi:AIPR family protein [Nonomuraea fuscirosea]|uniref:AIPR family protein n=1 Tax=Nonomuraea fuscirosea TaxID=1291556 RepID=UPI0037AB9C16